MSLSISIWCGAQWPPIVIRPDRSSSAISNIIGAYLIAMIVGALLFPVLSNRTTPRIALIVGTTFIAVGYLMFLPFNATPLQVTLNMVVAGIGSGALVAALPASAAAPLGQTGIAAGLTNTTKTIGGSFASAVFAVVLIYAGGQAALETVGTYAGYLTVFAICGGTALVSAILLLAVPKLAFSDEVVAGEAAPVTPPAPRAAAADPE